MHLSTTSKLGYFSFNKANVDPYHIRFSDSSTEKAVPMLSTKRAALYNVGYGSVFKQTAVLLF